MTLNQKGHILPFTIFLFMMTLNIFIFVVLCNLNTNNYYNDKDKYYHVFILEERAKKHIQEKAASNTLVNREQEMIYYDEAYIYFIYNYNSSLQEWIISVRIHYDDIDEFGTITYDVETNIISFKKE